MLQSSEKVIDICNVVAYNVNRVANNPGQKGENMKTSKAEYYEMIRNAFECSRDYLYKGKYKDAYFQLGLARGIIIVMNFEKVITQEEFNKLLKATFDIERCADNYTEALKVLEE